MAITIIQLFDEVSTAHRALDALAAAGFARDELNLVAHQERVDTLEAMSSWAPRVVAVPGVGAMLVIGSVAAALSGTAGEVAGEGVMRSAFARELD